MESGDTLVVTKLDRIGRDSIDVQKTIERFTELGIRLIVLQLGNPDRTSSSGALMVIVLAAVADCGPELTIETTLTGQTLSKGCWHAHGLTVKDYGSAMSNDSDAADFGPNRLCGRVRLRDIPGDGDDHPRCSTRQPCSVNDGFGLDPVSRLFDLPDPERSLKAQPGGLQTGDEIDERSSHSRPVAVAHSRRLRGKMKINAVILEQSVIDRILTHLGLQARAPPRAPARGGFEQAAL